MQEQTTKAEASTYQARIRTKQAQIQTKQNKAGFLRNYASLRWCQRASEKRGWAP
jgi:hypothetical protein